MCGILGRFVRQGDIEDVDVLCAATNLLIHRGPDDGAWWSDRGFFLGHRRLAIIDLSQGGQPMAICDGRFVITFNGEIYNFIEVREELIGAGVRFSTNSDTEVILHGYHHWGPSVASHLIGMFAFAIADRQEGTLYLARDRFGEKPLFVHESTTAISFASELGALTAIPDIECKMNRNALGGYLCLNYVPGDATLMEGIRRVPPATWRLYTSTTVREETYWTPPRNDQYEVAPTETQAIIDLRKLIDDATLLSLRSDVPVALFLSGGIDSSIIAETAVRQGKLKHAYCLDFAEEGFSEWSAASTVAKTLGIELRRATLTASALEDFVAIVGHADDPLADSSALAVWTLARQVAPDYKVCISGDGGDELFGGYLTYKATLYHRLLVKPLPDVFREFLHRVASRIPVGRGKVSTTYKLMRFLRAANLPSGEAHFTWNGSWLPLEAAGLLRDPRASDAAKVALSSLVARHRISSEPSLSELQRLDASEYLPNDILTKVDRMTMAHGLEARAPFLVPSVAEYALRLPDSLKLTAFGKPKKILRAIATQIYGESIGRAKKQGFSIPIHQWLRGPARALTEELLSRREIDQIGVFDTEAVLRAKTRHMTDRAQLGYELWGMMVLVAWYRARILTVAVTTGRGALRRMVFPYTP